MWSARVLSILPLLRPRQKLPAAHNDAHLHAHIHTLLDRFADGEHGVEINAVLLFSRKGFSAELEQNAFVLWLQD